MGMEEGKVEVLIKRAIKVNYPMGVAGSQLVERERERERESNWQKSLYERERGKLKKKV